MYPVPLTATQDALRRKLRRNTAPAHVLVLMLALASYASREPALTFLCLVVNMTEGPPAYGQPPQVYRRGSQEQLSQRMGQMAIHSPRPVYPDANYSVAPAYHERMPYPPPPPPPQGNDRNYYPYYGQTTPVTIPPTVPPTPPYSVVHTNRDCNGVASG